MKIAVITYTFCMGLLQAIAPDAAAREPVIKIGETGEQVKGDVRVILIQISRTTLVGKMVENGKGLEKKTTHPMLQVTYLVERIGEIPAGNILSGSLEVYESGRRIDLESPQGYVTAVKSTIYRDFAPLEDRGLEIPKQVVRERAYVCDYSIMGVTVSSRKITIKITAGFENQKHRFSFENIEIY